MKVLVRGFDMIVNVAVCDNYDFLTYAPDTPPGNTPRAFTYRALNDLALDQGVSDRLGVVYKIPNVDNPLTHPFKDLANLRSPVGPLIFAKSLTKFTSVSVPDGIVTVIADEDTLMQYTDYNKWLNDTKAKARIWAWHNAWDSVAAWVGTQVEFTAVYGLSFTTAEWSARVALAAFTPSEREAWRIANPPTAAPTGTNATTKYRVIETVLLLDADYWFPYKVSFSVDNY